MNIQTLIKGYIKLNFIGLIYCVFFMFLFGAAFGALGSGSNEIFLFSILATSGIFFDRVLKREEGYDVKKMYLTLPLTVRELILSKYLFACCVYIFLSVVYFLIGLLSLYRHYPLPDFYMLPAALLVTVFLFSVRLALFHIFDYGRTRFFYNMFIFIFLLNSLYQYVEFDKYFLLILNFPLIFVSLAVSVLVVLLSYRLTYKKFLQ